jgi:hypothetical protein
MLRRLSVWRNAAARFTIDPLLTYAAGQNCNHSNWALLAARGMTARTLP